MIKVTFHKTNEVFTTELTLEEMLKRMDRLSWLMVLTEGYEEGDYKSIHDKAERAYNKQDNFTGIIRLNVNEKDCIGALMHDSMANDKDIEVLSHYYRY